MIELLVVIAIIALLVSILVPSLKRAKELVRRSVCLSNLRSLHTAYVLYAHENNQWINGNACARYYPTTDIFGPPYVVNGMGPAMEPYVGKGSPLWQCPSDATADCLAKVKDLSLPPAGYIHLSYMVPESPFNMYPGSDGYSGIPKPAPGTYQRDALAADHVSPSVVDGLFAGAPGVPVPPRIIHSPLLMESWFFLDWLYNSPPKYHPDGLTYVTRLGSAGFIPWGDSLYGDPDWDPNLAWDETLDALGG